VGRGHQSKKGRIRPVEVTVGDKIIFSKYAGDKISQDGVNFVVIRETEILGLAAN
jgi:chaperonin GroES